MKTVALQYGIASGERQGKRFRRALKQAGYKVIKDAAKADIIVAHSAGCFWLPEAPTHQKLMLIDPPYWPGKTVGERGKQRLKTNLHPRKQNYHIPYWLARNLWGLFYVIRDIKRTRAIVRLAGIYDLATVVQNHRALLIHNDDDDWLTANLEELDQTNPNLIVRHLPGDHDNCWYNPQPYIDLLQSEL
jgi:hypothetical protein